MFGRIYADHETGFWILREHCNFGGQIQHWYKQITRLEFSGYWPQIQTQIMFNGADHEELQEIAEKQQRHRDCSEHFEY